MPEAITPLIRAPWRRRSRAGAWALAALGLISTGVQARAEDTSIGVYSGRHYNSDQKLYKQFTAKTGIQVKLLEAKDDSLIERLRQEGKNTPADVLVLVDAARRERAASLDLLQPARSAALLRTVPLSLRDSKGRWVGLTRRVRVVLVNPALVKAASIRTYGDLANPALKGKLCLRDRKSVYNQSLVASQILIRGDAQASRWVKGMTSNVTQPYFSSDIPLIRALGSGQCGVGLVNTYYLARLLNGESGPADRALARKLQVVFPKPAHVNISGAGITRYAKNPQAALKLIEFLASPVGGKGYAEANHEYPLKGYGDDAILKGMGRFQADGLSAEQLGSRNRDAVKLMEANGWL
jgi:iron(III) transport system substrate-binding protein